MDKTLKFVEEETELILDHLRSPHSVCVSFLKVHAQQLLFYVLQAEQETTPEPQRPPAH